MFGEPFATSSTAAPRALGLAVTLVGVILLATAQRAAQGPAARSGERPLSQV